MSCKREAFGWSFSFNPRACTGDPSPVLNSRNLYSWTLLNLIGCGCFSQTKNMNTEIKDGGPAFPNKANQMNPELQQRIADIKAECEEILRLEKILSGKKWTPALTSSVYNARVLTDTDYPWTGNVVAEVLWANDAPFIAHSRNVSPAMARVVVGTIRWFEELGEHRSVPPLEHLANQWEGKP